METIIGNKVILRRQILQDADFFAYWFNQPDIMFQCGFSEKTTLEKEQKALKFYEKIGFKKEGNQEQGYYYNGEYMNFVMMRILKEDWIQKR